MPDRPVVEEPLTFIRTCIEARHIYWSHHVNMRMRVRKISRGIILNAVDTYVIIESYSDDKYLPSYLVLARSGEAVFHILFALDAAESNVRVVTAYRPDPAEWQDDYRTRTKR